MSKLKFGFVDGSTVPPDPASPLLIYWNRCNNMVTSWLLNSVSVDIRSSIVYMKSAHQIWRELEVRYSQSNVPKLFQLRYEIAHLKQDNLSIAAYFAKFRALNDELECMLTKPRCSCLRCSCSINKKLDEFDLDVQLSQFLMGLNEQFTAIRGQLLMMKPVPDLSQSYSLLLQEGSQRALMHPVSMNSESIAMSVRNSLPQQHKSKSGKGASRPSSENRMNLQCDYCNMSGHTRDKCFCLHGYPDWHKLYGQPKPKPRSAHSVVKTSSPVMFDQTSTPPVPTVSNTASTNNSQLSEDQYKQILQYVQKNLPATQISPSSDIQPTSWCPPLYNNQFAGTVMHFASTIYPGIQYNSDYWIVDTGATDHISPFLNLLQNATPIQSSLHLPNGTTVPITHVGTVQLSTKVVLHNVLCVPSFTYNLLSVSKLLTDNKCEATFTTDQCFLKAVSWHQSLPIGKEMNGLYLLSQKSLQHSTAELCAQSVVSNVTVPQCGLWHARCGHIPPQIMKLIPVPAEKCPSPCEDCMYAKHTRQVFPQSTSNSTEIFQLLHVDLWGPYRHKTHNTCSMFLTLVDDKSRHTWTYLLPTKSQASTALKSFIAYVTNHFPTTTVKVVRSDNGMEFLNTDLQSYFADHGIIHQTTCAYTPQQNGCVERKHRTLLNVARALRFHSAMPIQYWGDCLLTATYLVNRTPSVQLNGCTPYELLFKSLPDYSVLKVFGCLCFAANLPHPTDKFAPRAVKGVFVGYPFAKKGYKILDLNTYETFVSRDVHFYEHIFPFKTVHKPVTNLFPKQSSDVVDDLPSMPLVMEHPTAEHVPPTTTTETSSSSADESIVRRSSRHHKLPARFTEYTGLPTHLINSIQVLCPTRSYGSNLGDFVQALPLDTEHVAFAATSENIPVPSTYKQAIKDPLWCEAISVELAAMEANHTWDVQPLPPGKKLVGCKWLFKIKYTENRAVDRYKARLVAKGFTQTEGLDYFETFAPVAKMATLRLLLTLASKKNWVLKQLDVVNAFLHGTLEEEVYMALPPGYSPPATVLAQFPNQRLVCHLVKSIYGLKQAPRRWFVALTNALLQFGFTQMVSDSSLLRFEKNKSVAFLLIYVDDCLCRC